MIRFTCGEKKIGKVSKSLKKLCPWLKLEAKYTAKEESKFIGKKKDSVTSKSVSSSSSSSYYYYYYYHFDETKALLTVYFGKTK